MKIKRINLKDYKRFTELTITGIPEGARLVVLVGPNGSGKSSVFDAFLVKARAAFTNFELDGNIGQYYEKMIQARYLTEISNRIEVEFHNSENTDF